jgi:hypothetical protein
MQKDELGKIEKVEFGFWDGRFGLRFTLTAGGWNVDDFWGGWASRPEHAQWTQAEQDAAIAAIWHRLIKLMGEAKVQDFSKLVGKPIMVTTEGMMLKSWRILSEVL